MHAEGQPATSASSGQTDHKCNLVCHDVRLRGITHLNAGVVSLPDDKIVKLLSAILEVLQADTITVKALESLIGMLHWVMQLSPVLKPWLRSLYHDAARPLATNFSVSMVGSVCLNSEART